MGSILITEYRIFVLALQEVLQLFLSVCFVQKMSILSVTNNFFCLNPLESELIVSLQ